MPHAFVIRPGPRPHAGHRAPVAIRTGRRAPWPATLLLLAACTGVAVPARELALTARCGAVDLGGGLYMTAWHCRGMLPFHARVPTAGSVGEGATTGPLDYIVSLLPGTGAATPLACEAGAKRGVWRGQPVRFTTGAIPGTVTLTLPARRGDSGAPVLTASGALATMVVGVERSSGLGVALHPEVVCAAVELARSRLR